MLASYNKFQQLSVQKHQKLLIIKFNRPAKKNALERLTLRELTRAILSAAYDDSISTIALTGVGDFFTAGTDLTEMQQHSDKSKFLKTGNFYLHTLIMTLIHCRKVLIAVVNGPCIGIGFTMCGLCDIVYCTENAYFVAPFAKLGMCPEACSSYMFPRILGPSKASEVLYFGVELSAQQALQHGFVADALRYEDLNTKLWPQLVKYAELPVCSLRATKRLMHPLEERQRLIKALRAECSELAKLRTGDDYLNALQRFSSRNKSKL